MIRSGHASRLPGTWHGLARPRAVSGASSCPRAGTAAASASAQPAAMRVIRARHGGGSLGTSLSGAPPRERPGLKMDALYVASATASGSGRSGKSVASDGSLELTMVPPPELGGPGTPGTNPEQLFALGYAACFLSALTLVAGKRGVDAVGGHRHGRRRARHAGPRLRPVGRAQGALPGHRPRAGAEVRRHRAPGLPVLERDAQQHRGRARAAGERPGLGFRPAATAAATASTASSPLIPSRRAAARRRAR